MALIPQVLKKPTAPDEPNNQLNNVNNPPVVAAPAPAQTTPPLSTVTAPVAAPPPTAYDPAQIQPTSTVAETTSALTRTGSPYMRVKETEAMQQRNRLSQPGSLDLLNSSTSIQ